MPKRITSLELPLGERPKRSTLTRWLYDQLRSAIIEGRLTAGTRLPSSRDFATHYEVSRGTTVAVFEQLQSEGFVSCRTGSGTWVNELPKRLQRAKQMAPPSIPLPSPLSGLVFSHPARPFRSHEPALSEFPMDIWARLGSRCMRRASISLLAQRDARGHLPLREALTEYLGASRGVRTTPDQIMIVSGVQQALDLLARVLLKRGDTVWIEDPGYFGAEMAFRNAGAKIVPVPVDDDGISVESGRRFAPHAKGAYVTPAHQFPLGVMTSLERRLELLSWARTAGSFVIEDDYDGEYRFQGKPVPVLQSLDRSGNVILVGSFNKLLFSSVRLGYIVMPPRLVDSMLALRFAIDQNTIGFEQALLTDFITEGHMGRHIRRMREVYAHRLGVLLRESERHLQGILDISPIQAGLYTMGYLRNAMSSRQAETCARERGVETMGIDRFMFKRKDLRGLLLGFAAFDERSIKSGVADLAIALRQRR